MKSDFVHIEPIKLDSFIWSCLIGNGRMVIRVKDNKAVLDNGRYIVKKEGRYVVQKHYSELAICEIMKRMINKYQRFEYNGFLYHSPELEIWTKEEL